MNILYETDNLVLKYNYEATFLIEKETGKTLLEDEFFGDPSCGLIDKNNKWAIIGGEHLTIWTPKIWKRIENVNLKWIYAVRAKDSKKVEVLTDPWKSNSAIWEIIVTTFEFHKIRDFNDYIDKEYSESIIW